MEKKRLTRSENKIIGGICAGIAEFLDVDPTIIRIIYTVLTVCTAFSGTIIYLLLWLLMPSKK